MYIDLLFILIILETKCVVERAFTTDPYKQYEALQP